MAARGIALAVVSASLAACGQKGALVLPKPAPSVAPPVPESTTLAPAALPTSAPAPRR